jgi:hypothetical protein
LLFGANPIEKLKAAQGSTIAAWGACVEEEIMTREARLMSGTILITVPTIQYGGYFLLTSLMISLIYAGALILAVAVVTLGIGLLRHPT